MIVVHIVVFILRGRRFALRNAAPICTPRGRRPGRQWQVVDVVVVRLHAVERAETALASRRRDAAREARGAVVV